MRFYSGISFKFRKKHLKWLLIPIFAILSYFGFFGIINTYALSNTDTSFTFNIQEQDFSNQFFSDMTYKDVLDYFTNYESQYYDIVVFYSSSKNSINIVLEPKNTGIFKGIYGQNVGRYSSNLSFYSSVNNKIEYTAGLSINTNVVSSNSQIFLKIKQCLDSNICSSSFSSTDNTGTFAKSTNGTAGNYTILSSSAITNIGNNNSYVYEDYSLGTYLYSSQIPVYLRFPASPPNYFGKSVYINGQYYTTDSVLPTYVDLFFSNNNEDNEYFYGYKDYLSTIYTNFLPTDINRFKIDVSFDTNINNISAFDYYNNLDMSIYNCYGRINHNDNYYTYEKFSNCTFEVNQDFSVDSDNDNVKFSIKNLEIYDSNNNKITNFSNYDKLFFYISFSYNDLSLDRTIRNLSFNYNYSFLYSDNFKAEIYDSFLDLPLYSKFLFSNTGSSNNLTNNLFVSSKKDIFNNSLFLYAQKYDLSTLEPLDLNLFVGSDTFQNFSVNSSKNIGYMVYNKTDNVNSSITSYGLDLILMSDIVVSYNDVFNNNFYYVDSTGNVVNSTIDIDYSNGLDYDLTFNGLLPSGPVDSLLNIPFYYTNKVINSLNQNCEPWTFNFVFNKPFTLPCFDTFYDDFPPALYTFLEVIPCAFILISYFKHLYKKVDRATSLNTNTEDEWGVL